MRERNRTERVGHRRSLRFSIRAAAPFDLERSLAAMASFMPAMVDRPEPAAWRAVLWPEGKPVLAEFRQKARDAAVAVEAAAADRKALRAAAAGLISAELDLRPFYRRVARHPVLGALTRALRGMKPLRPATLFEMAVIAITEQQISLAAAYHIRQRLIERFGARLGTLWAFPSPQTLAKAPSRALRACGLSRAKSRYIAALARRVAQGALDLDALRALPDEEARARLCAEDGFGPWSADYVLVRGLGRMDSVPLDDLGVRDAVGEYLGGGRRVSAKNVARLLRPFAPYRGLAVFYLLAAHRLGMPHLARGRVAQAGRHKRRFAITAPRPRSSAG